MNQENLDKTARAGRKLLAEHHCPICGGKGEVPGEDGVVPCTAEECRARREKYGS